MTGGGRKADPEVMLAKSKPDYITGQPVTVKVHCAAVSELACTYGSELDLGDMAEAAGLCHDYGKYGQLFKYLLLGKASGIDHALPGAVMASMFSRRVAEAVAGHHAGLSDYLRLKPVLNDVMHGARCELPSGKQPSLFGISEFKAAQDLFLADWPDANKIFSGVVGKDGCFDLASGRKWKDNLYMMLLERFLFSCLVDADYTVSCREETGDMPSEVFIRGRAGRCLERLECLRAGVVGSSAADAKVNALREAVYRSCVDFDTSKRFYLLSAPTGSGKSFAMARFAIGQCMADDSLDRVIFVLPFLTLTDQVAGMARGIFDDVLVDTSTADGTGRRHRYLTETWNAECIVTTTVQFFQSLFSNRPGDCRKLHRIVNSVIVLDEAQAIPSGLSRICLQCLYWLSERFGCKILVSTATPPRYDMIDGLDFSPEVLFDRSVFNFPLSKTGFDVVQTPVSLSDVADMSAKIDNCCVIVNLRAHALAIYNHWLETGVSDIYFITTDLCPDHRRAVIDEIAERQKAGLPVHASATQCIEAGVDLDFRKVFRAWAPLPSLVQSAGRQDRNGRYGAGSGMAVFLPHDPDRHGRRLYPSAEYYRDTSVTMRFSDHLDWSAFDGYYKQLFRDFGEKEGLRDALLNRDYKEFAQESRLIRSGGRQVIVPYGDAYDRLLDAFYDGTVTKADLAAVAGITVSTYATDGFDACCSEIIIRRRGVEMPSGAYILLDRNCYDVKTGLDFSKAGPLMV